MNDQNVIKQNKKGERIKHRRQSPFLGPTTDPYEVRSEPLALRRGTGRVDVNPVARETHEAQDASPIHGRSRRGPPSYSRKSVTHVT